MRILGFQGSVLLHSSGGGVDIPRTGSRGRRGTVTGGAASRLQGAGLAEPFSPQTRVSLRGDLKWGTLLFGKGSQAKFASRVAAVC